MARPFVLNELRDGNEYSGVTAPAVVARKTVPRPSPPCSVVPYRLPSAPTISVPSGFSPFLPSKLNSTWYSPPEGAMRNSVPLSFTPPRSVVPYRLPSPACTSPPYGSAASTLVCPSECSTVYSPARVRRKTTPSPFSQIGRAHV